MLEEKMKETMEPANFFIEISATPDAQKPGVIIRPSADASTQTFVTKYRNLRELTEALVKLGEDPRTVANDLERIYKVYAPAEDVAMAEEPACYTRNITFEQARDFGWID